MSSLDTTAEFGAPSFDAKQWLNASLAADAASTEPVDMRLSVLLTKLQLRAAVSAGQMAFGRLVACGARRVCCVAAGATECVT